MKKLITITLALLGINGFSQDMNKMLQGGKWYLKNDGKKMVYSKKQAEKNQSTNRFLANGRMIYCGITKESSFDANGNEVVSEGFRCDSVWTYQVKNNMLKTQLLKQDPNYYKMLVKGETIELSPIKPEEFR